MIQSSNDRLAAGADGTGHEATKNRGAGARRGLPLFHATQGPRAWCHWLGTYTDGSVEAMVQGGADAIAAIIALARRGPPSAHVTDVKISDADGRFEEFDLRPTE